MSLCPPQTWASAVTGNYLYGNSANFLLSPLIYQPDLLL